MSNGDNKTSKRKATSSAEVTPDQLLKRRRIMAAALLALGALALWASSRLVWARVEAEDNLSPQQSFDALGSDWSPWLTPLALVLLAAILAAFTLRGWGLRVLAVLLAIGGLVASLPALSLLTEGGDSNYAAQAAEVPSRFQVLLVDTQTVPALVVLLGTAATVAYAVFLLRAASGRDALASKYQTPAVRREEAEAEIFAEHERRKAAAAAGDEASDSAGAGTEANGEPNDADNSAHASERILWDALDTGIDPTDDDRLEGDGPSDRPAT